MHFLLVPIIVVLGLLLVVAVGAFLSLFGGIFVYFLWNAVVPEVFGLSALTFMQSWGLTWLCWILFRGGNSSINNGKDDD